MRKKEILARIFNFTGINFLSHIFNKFKKNKLIILAYHRISDIDNETTFPFDIELISASKQDFYKQLKYVKKYYNPISFKDLIKHNDNNDTLPSSPIIITFDDGHLDNFISAYPLLKELKIPATIFLSTGYIDSNSVFWFDWIAYIILNTEFHSFTIDNKRFSVNFNMDRESKIAAIKNTLSYLKNINNTERLKCIKELSDILNVKLLDAHKSLSGALKWEQIIEMSNNNIEFGSHTVSHPILSKLDDSELQYELTESKKVIESHINKNVDVIAYPVGGAAEYSDKVINECINSKYKLGITYIPGVNNIPLNNHFELKRLHVERYTSFSYFKSMLVFPSIFKD